VELTIRFDGFDPPYGEIRATTHEESESPGRPFSGLLGLLKLLEDFLTPPTN